jgi:hypothetical protein
MTAPSRRNMLVSVFCGALIATLGLAVLPSTAESTPLAIAKGGVVKTGTMVEKAVVVVVHPRRHRRGRHWRCWWHRGRRVCGWR